MKKRAAAQINTLNNALDLRLFLARYSDIYAAMNIYPF